MYVCTCMCVHVCVYVCMCTFLAVYAGALSALDTLSAKAAIAALLTTIQISKSEMYVWHMV